MIVVDVNVLAYFWLKGDFTHDAERVFIKDPLWAAPILWRSEFRNLLLGYVRRKSITIEDASLLIQEAELQMIGTELPVGSGQVMACAAESTCSAYDCEYVSLAKELKVPLITSDKKILREFPKHALSMKKFISE